MTVGVYPRLYPLGLDTLQNFKTLNSVERVMMATQPEAGLDATFYLYKNENFQAVLKEDDLSKPWYLMRLDTKKVATSKTWGQPDPDESVNDGLNNKLFLAKVPMTHPPNTRRIGDDFDMQLYGQEYEVGRRSDDAGQFLPGAWKMLSLFTPRMPHMCRSGEPKAIFALNLLLKFTT